MVKPESLGFGRAVLAFTVLAALALAWLTWRDGSFVGLWLTPDQQARQAYDALDFGAAAELFEDPTWKGVAAYRAGQYPVAAASFGRSPTAEAFFNRGNALMKGREYGNAIKAYEQAVAEAPEWTEAQENLRLSRYVLDYIEQTREQTDTGDESELGADDFVFDNTKDKGVEIVITQQSTIEKVSAEKWMRSVDTQTRDFLITRFALEASRDEGSP